MRPRKLKSVTSSNENECSRQIKQKQPMERSQQPKKMPCHVNK